MESVKVLCRFNLGSAILSINKSEKGVIATTQDFQACIIENGALKGRVKLHDFATTSHKFAKSNSAGREFICIATQNFATIAKIQSHSIAKFAKIQSHKKPLSASAFSADSAMLATGGEDGKVFLYLTKNFQKILSLPYRPDYISSISFSGDCRFVFASCFDKSNIIFDLQRARVVNIFYTNEVVECGEFFSDNCKLMLITRDFKSLIYDISAKEILSEANLFNAWPNTLCIDEVAKIAIVGTREGGIYLINIAENSTIFYLQIDEIVGISALCVHLGCIFLGGVNGEILVIGYMDNDEQFYRACEAKNYAEASRALEENIFLSLLPCAKVFDTDWEGVLKEAIALLGEDKIDEALALTAPFTKHNLAKKNAFGVYLDKKDSVKKFKELVRGGAFEEAYNMTLSAKFLLKTSYYEALEDAWHRAFNNARKALEDGNFDVAKRHLEAFMKTPKKDTAMQLLNNLHIFLDADSFIKEQNFKEYFALVGNFSYLKECVLYKKVLALGMSFFDKLLEAKNANNYAEFERIYAFLLNFPSYRDAIVALNIAVAKKKEFLSLISQNKRAEVYKLASECEELQYLAEFKAFSAEFEGVANNAIDLAQKGEVAHLGEIFGEYLKIGFWSERVKSIYQMAYLAEFEANMGAQINWEQSVKNYIQIFGKDDDIDAFCEKYAFNFEFGDFFKHPFAFQKTLISRVVGDE